MPSLPPALKPSMIRPRAGQRNSGEAGDASASAVFVAPAFGSALTTGVSSVGGLLTGRLRRLGLGDDGLRRVFLRLLLRGLFLGLRPLHLGRVGLGIGREFLDLLLAALDRAVGDLPARGAMGALVGLGDSPAGARIVDRHDHPHAALDLGSAGQAVGAEERRSGDAVPARERIEGLALRDDDRRASDGSPADRRTADRLRLRRRRGQRPAGDGLRRRKRRGGHFIGRRAPGGRCRGLLRVEGIGEAAVGKATDVARAAGKPDESKASQRKTRKRTSADKRKAITHLFEPTT